MERDYLNLITNLESEKRRVTEVLDTRTRERDEVRTDVERLKRQLASTNNMSVKTEEEHILQSERITSLETDLKRCKDALSERDELISARNTELESVRQAVCAAADEKLRLQEEVRVETERRDKFQSNKLERVMNTVAEKDQLIREKEVEIDELRESIMKRKKEREAINLDVQALQEELESERSNISELRSTLAGYRLEIRRLEALEKEREDRAVARSIEQDKRGEAHAREANAKVEELNATIMARDEENAALSKQVQDLKAELQAEADNAANLLEKISTLKADLETARTSTPEKVQRELEEQADKISTLELELSKKDDDIETKSGELLRAQTELSQVAESNTNLCKELEQTKDRLEEEIAKADESKESFEEMHHVAMQNLADELAQTKEELQNQTNHATELEQQVKVMEEQVESSDKEKNDEVQDIKLHLESSKNAARDLEDKCKDLQEQVDALVAEKDEMEGKHKDEMSSLKLQLELTKAKLDQETEQSKEWKNEISRLENEVSKQKDAVDAARELSAQSFVNAKAAQRETEDELNRQYLETVRLLESAENENDQLKDELADKDDLINAREDELKGMSAMVSVFEIEKDTLEARLKATEIKLEESRVETANVVGDSSSSRGWLRRGNSSKNLDEVEATIAEKDRTIDAKSHEIQALMTDLQQSMMEREDIRSELHRLKQDMESRINDLIEEKQQLTEERTGMKEALDQSFADNADLKGEISELKEQLIFESRRAYHLRKDIQSLSANKNASTPDMHSRAVGSDSDMVSSDAVSKSLQTKLDEVAKETERKRQRMIRIRQSFSNDDDGSPTKDVANLDTSSATLSTLHASLEEKEAQLKAKSKEVEELERVMQDMATTHTNQAAITKECDALEDTVSEYESTIDDLRKDLADRDSVVNIKNDEIKKLQSTLEECNAEKQALIDDVAELKAQLDAEVKRSAELLAAEKEARAEVARLEAAIAEKEEEINNLAIRGVDNEDSESKANEIMELREQLIEESRCAFQLSKEVEQLKIVNERASEEIHHLKGEVMKSPGASSAIGSPSNANMAQVYHENEALKHEFESVSHQLQEASQQNSALKAELDVLRRKDADAGRRSAVFRARSEKKPWVSPPRLTPSKLDTPRIDFSEGRDDQEDEASDRGQTRGDQRYETSSRNNSISGWSEDKVSDAATMVPERIEALEKALNEARHEKAELDEAVRNREKYVEELEYRCGEYSKKISELKRYVTAQSPSSNAKQALAVKEKEVERLHKDMVSLKMLASAKFRELESRAARAIDYEEQAQALRVALENTKAQHKEDIEKLKAEQSHGRTGIRQVEGLKESKSFRESKLQHKYEVQLKKVSEEKDMLRKEVVALTAERRAFLEKIRMLEQTESSSIDVSSKMIMSENNALKTEIEKLSKESKKLKGKLEYYELI